MESLPIELTEKFLINLVIEELRERFTKSSWENEARKRFNELKKVCSTWRSIIETRGFKVAFHRVLSRTDISPITVTQIMTQESPVSKVVIGVTKVKEKLYTICYNKESQAYFLNVYQCKNDVFELEKRRHITIENLFTISGLVACHEFLYFFGTLNRYACLSDVRLLKIPVGNPDAELTTVKVFKEDPLDYVLAVSNDGDLIACVDDRDLDPEDMNTSFKVMIFDRSGSIKQSMEWPVYVDGELMGITQSVNGKIIILYKPHAYGSRTRVTLAEVDMNSKTVQTYYSKKLQNIYEACRFPDYNLTTFSHGRIVVANLTGGDKGYLALFNSDFKCYTITDLPGYESDTYTMYHDVEKNQLIIASSSITVYSLTDWTLQFFCPVMSKLKIEPDN